MVMKMAMISIASRRAPCRGWLIILNDYFYHYYFNDFNDFNCKYESPPAADGISSWSNVLSRTTCSSHETHANDAGGDDEDTDHDEDDVEDDNEEKGHEDHEDDDCCVLSGGLSRLHILTKTGQDDNGWTIDNLPFVNCI